MEITINDNRILFVWIQVFRLFEEIICSIWYWVNRKNMENIPVCNLNFID